MRTTIVAAVILMMTMMPVPAAKVEAPEVNLGALAYVDGWVDDIADTVLYCLSEAAPSWEVDAEGISFDFEQEAPRQLMVIARTGDQVFEKRVIVHNLCANGVPSVEDLDLPRPGYPGLPDAPEVPEAPGAPELPEVPEIPEAPELPLPGPETLAQLIGLVQGVVSEIKCDAGRTGFNLAPGVASVDDVCRAVNSETGNCEKNGDCRCGSQPEPEPTILDPNPEPDTDRDGVIDSEDDDLECDHLTNELEDGLRWLDSRNANDPKLIVTDGSDVAVELRLNTVVLRTTDYEELGEWDGEAGLYNSAPNSPPDLYSIIKVGNNGELGLSDVSPEGFNKASHPWNIVSERDLGPAVVEIGGLSSRYDTAAWPNRDSASGYPKLTIDFDIWEDDGSSDRAPDDSVTRQMKEFVLSQISSPGQVGSMPSRVDTWGIIFGDLLELDAEVYSNINQCALEWASQVADKGTYAVYPSHLSSACL